jgi:nucleoside-diphosphate-sugar epimerase
MHMVTLRPYAVYGPWEDPSRFIPQLVLSGLKGELPPLVQPGIARDFVFVDDFVDACLSAAAKTDLERGCVLNVGTGFQITIEQAVAEIKNLLNIPQNPQWGSMPNRLWDTTVWVAKSDRIKALLGWEPRYQFREGLIKTIDWYKTRL